MAYAVFINGETWVVCGGRGFDDRAMFDTAMLDLTAYYGLPEIVVHGDAPGADKMADDWGKKLALTVIAERADWATHGKAAGPIRSKEHLRREWKRRRRKPTATGRITLIQRRSLRPSPTRTS